MRERAGLNLGNLDDFKPQKPKPIEKQPAEQVAREEGFTSRQPKAFPEAKIDGRSLRATGRKAQLNMAVKPATKDRFWSMAQAHGFTAGEEFLLAMMEAFEHKGRD
ncbi:stability/partitioning determinant [Palleronia caenipelagi]|uniref:Stability/partitioning determinant n=1 Tax=Palleronia caenipelagi TaxID=2489174 RepID=A0A547PN62_9RHOB|nr:stability/partitioning determinant [Palleronia caenipelagi]TRD15464.1 stability/partitioning determinant [Palleronia caenipelagi]